jgi:hypothetical protein
MRIGDKVLRRDSKEGTFPIQQGRQARKIKNTIQRSFVLMSVKRHVKASYVLFPRAVMVHSV